MRIGLVALSLVGLIGLTGCESGCPEGTRAETRQETRYTLEPGFNLQTGQYDVGKPGIKIVTVTECVPV